MSSQIYRRIHVVLGGAHPDGRVRVLLLVIVLPLSIHGESAVDELGETALLQVERVGVIRKHLKIAISLNIQYSSYFSLYGELFQTSISGGFTTVDCPLMASLITISFCGTFR